ncbi:hypothetical protein [Marinobacter similis]|uniref:Uncharacterized protein n=1 Tax=Marinobacter similis TaxID=1420916 RepID=W5YFN1_9GAMM|nr:hypothetical protein [Marinobacter similis]AHI27876.1 hypothetical protein AU14_02075 [Marinobacter similis]
MDKTKKGSQLARRKKHSTLTTGVYYPRPDTYSSNYYAVLVDRKPYLLFACNGDGVAMDKATSLADSENFRTLLEATATDCDRIEAQPLNGRDIDWTGEHTVISASRSGDFETGTGEAGEIRAILMSGSHRAVADTLCIDSALAPLIDSNFPYISSFDLLPELTDRDVRLSLGNLAARNHPRGRH